MRVQYGLTHTLEGVPIVREAKTLKVGIGLPRGKAVHVWIDEEDQWCIQGGPNVRRVGTREEAEEAYHAARSEAPDRKFPGRLSYFTFSNVGADGSFEPDFEAIEMYGSMPRVLDIMFVEPDPFDNSYQMWTSTELKCEGDGKDAKRVVTLGASQTDQRYRDVAAEAMKRGDKHFEVLDGCWMFGCPFANGDCKPHGRLVFQLARTPRLGSTAYFDTTGFRSVAELSSSLRKLLTVTGRGEPSQGRVHGIPLKLCMRPYKVTYEERGAKKSGTQNAVWIEFRATDAMGLQRELLTHAAAYEGGPRLLNGSTAVPVDITDMSELAEAELVVAPPPPNAAALAAEFYPEKEPDEFDSEGGGATQSVGPRMPVRKATPAAQEPVRATAPESTPEAAGDGVQASYLEVLQARTWKCLPAQKGMMLQRLAVFPESGATEDQVRSLMVEEFNVESPAQLDSKQMIKALTLVQRAIPVSPAAADGSDQSAPQANVVAAQHPSQSVRRVLFE